MASMIPLIIRMGLIHLVLQYGTNNISTENGISAIRLEHHITGAKLVLAARIFYAAFIWMNKLTVSEFLKRITIALWRPSYEWTLQGIRVFLGLTFIGVVVATLAECSPFNHYWQVIPDPGPHCRSGYAQLITMGVSDIVTDVLLIVFPVTILVLRSAVGWQRKLLVGGLFSLSIIMVAITATRIPEVILHRGRQQYRTVWASSEILASTAVSNAVILGSFLRDKGHKKSRFRAQSMSDSIERVPTRRSTMAALQRVGSDEDLFRFLGCRVPDHLLDEPDNRPRVAPVAPSAKDMKRRDSRGPEDSLRLNTEPVESGDDRSGSPQRPASIEISPAPSTKRSVSFFDVGGLLEDGAPSWDTRSRVTTLVGSVTSGTAAHDFATPTPNQSRRGSHALLADLGAMRHGSPFARRHSDAQQSLQRHRNAPIGVLGPMLERQETVQSLQDPGGLLGSASGEDVSHSRRGSGSLRPISRCEHDRPEEEDKEGMPKNVSALRTGTAWQPIGDERGSASNIAIQKPGQHELFLHDPGGLLRS
ncbi:hypothetical protein LTR17_004352 [Elasticomyces elasticus]|nr:hypothetical protein LTR17_004352 [Elasticomyces elasticus]